MKVKLFSSLIAITFLSSCGLNIHSVDRAVMLDKSETEIVTYAGGNAVGGINPEFNVGIGAGAKKGIYDAFTFGATADINYNSTKPDWVEHVFYGQVSIEQKFALVKDIFAIKFKEGIFLNNYFGTVKTNSTTGKYEFVTRESLIPYFSSALLLSPEGRKDKKWQLTIGLNSTLGLREGLMPWTLGGTTLFDYSKDKERFLTGFELGGGYQRLVNDGDVIYFSMGIFFSKFKRKSFEPLQ